MNEIYDKNKKYKKIGLLVIAIMVILTILFRVKVQSVSEYKAQQQSIMNEYHLYNEKQSNDTGSVMTEEDETNDAAKNATKDIAEGVSDGFTSSIGTSQQQNIKNSENQQDGGEESNSIMNIELTDYTGNDGSKDVSNEQNIPENDETKFITCSIEIKCDVLQNNMSRWSNLNKDREIVPGDYTYLKKVNITVTSGSSVYDVLMQAEAIYGLMVVTKPGSDYVVSINQLAEKDVGRWSGWMYKINGKQPETGCSSCYVQDKDVILWYYII